VPGRDARAARAGFEFVDEHGQPIAVLDRDDPDVLAEAKPTLPGWVDPRTSAGRSVLGCMLVVLVVWILSVRQDAQTAAGLPVVAPVPTFAAAPVNTEPGPVGPGTYRTGNLGKLTGPARWAAQLLGRLGEGDGIVPPSDGYCAPGPGGGAAPARVAAAVHAYLPRFGVITTTSGLGTRAQLCTLVVWAEHGSCSLAVSVAAPGRSKWPADSRWQALSTRSGTLEWVNRTSRAGWTVLVAGFGPSRVPELDALLRLANDPRLAW
jgi:hypothetical protein